MCYFATSHEQDSRWDVLRVALCFQSLRTVTDCRNNFPVFHHVDTRRNHPSNPRPAVRSIDPIQKIQQLRLLLPVSPVSLLELLEMYSVLSALVLNSAAHGCVLTNNSAHSIQMLRHQISIRSSWFSPTTLGACSKYRLHALLSRLPDCTPCTRMQCQSVCCQVR